MYRNNLWIIFLSLYLLLCACILWILHALHSAFQLIKKHTVLSKVEIISLEETIKQEKQIINEKTKKYQSFTQDLLISMYGISKREAKDWIEFYQTAGGIDPVNYETDEEYGLAIVKAMGKKRLELRGK